MAPINLPTNPEDLWESQTIHPCDGGGGAGACNIKMSLIFAGYIGHLQSDETIDAYHLHFLISS